MSAFTKVILSGSINGRQIPVNGLSTSSMTFVHSASGVSSQLDEVWLYASNSSTASVSCSICWGSSSLNDIMTFSILPNVGRTLIVDGKLLTNALPVTAFATVTASIVLDGFVNRIDNGTTTSNASASYSTTASYANTASYAQSGSFINTGSTYKFTNDYWNMVYRWQANGNFSDSSPFYNDGVLLGTGIFVPGSASVNQAFSYDGATGYMSTLINELPAKYSNRGLSFSMWFRTTTIVGGGMLSYQAANVGDATTRDFPLYMLGPSGSSPGVTGSIGFAYFAGTFHGSNSTKSYNDGNWHQAVVTMQNISGSILYVDGIQVASVAVSGSISNIVGSNMYWRTGNANFATVWALNYSSSFFSGSIQDTIIYNRTLSATDAATLYALGPNF